MNVVKSTIKGMLPKFVIDVFNKRKYYHEIKIIRSVPKYQKKALENLKNKQTIHCVFLAVSIDAWKYDNVYKLMSINPKFEPLILICPIVNNGRQNMLDRMEASFNYFRDKGYNVLKSYDNDKDKYINIRKDIEADILFYTNPYKGLIDERYYIENFIDYLTVYVGYYFNELADYKMAYDEYLHNLVWRRYIETNEHKSYAVKYSRNKGVNAVITGYPGIERFLYPENEQIVNSWKIKNNKYKKIIWAPHHSIEGTGTVNYSCFLMYYDNMIQLAEKYKDKVQIAFKPHPLLKNKLIKLWGKNKTELYYKKWSEMPNTIYVEGDYSDLFLTSDAMIHDSGSFLIEYLYVNKPVMRTLNNEPLDKLYNPFGLRCLEYYYFAKNADDIEHFIQCVLREEDPLKDKRTKFLQKTLIPDNSPSQNIINDIINSINNQIVLP